MNCLIVFIGPTGAGKSEQSHLLADFLHYRWLSTGELLREHVSGQPEQQMLAGTLLSDKEVVGLVNKTIKEFGPSQSYVVDGFPRTTAQAEWLLSQATAQRFLIKAVIHLHVPHKETIKRLLGRGRPDDHEAAIKQRLLEYEQVTLPVIKQFKASKVPIFKVNGQQTIKAVQHDIQAVLG